MTKTEEQAIALLKALSPESRSRVIASVEDDSLEGFAPGYEEEVARRVEEIKSGKVEGIPHSEVMRKLRSKVPNA